MLTPPDSYGELLEFFFLKSHKFTIIKIAWASCVCTQQYSLHSNSPSTCSGVVHVKGKKRGKHRSSQPSPLRSEYCCVIIRLTTPIFFPLFQWTADCGYFPGTRFSCSHMVVKTPLYCTRKCGCKGGCMSANCFLQPPRNGSTGQVPVLEHETFSDFSEKSDFSEWPLRNIQITSSHWLLVSRVAENSE